MIKRLIRGNYDGDGPLPRWPMWVYFGVLAPIVAWMLFTEGWTSVIAFLVVFPVVLGWLFWVRREHRRLRAQRLTEEAKRREASAFDGAWERMFNARKDT